jgi:hypothetical protein
VTDELPTGTNELPTGTDEPSAGTFGSSAGTVGSSAGTDETSAGTVGSSAGTDDFARRVRAHFPEGLTGIIVIGGTRTSFLYERPEPADPAEVGRIVPEEYARYGVRAYTDLLRHYYELGGQNLIVPGWAYQYFTESPRGTGGWRGEDFRRRFIPLARWLAGEQFVRFYEEMGIDPYFVGIDTLLHLPADDEAHALGAALRDFTRSWPYQPGRRTLIWEIASIPLYTFWRATTALTDAERAALEAELAAAADLAQVHHILYRFYTRAAVGRPLPVPHFYLANNRNGDLKLRGPLSMALSANNASLRCFYVPYPTLLTTRETLRTLIEDLMTEGGLRSHTADYHGQVSVELLRQERGRALALRADPRATLGLARRVTAGPADRGEPTTGGPGRAEGEGPAEGTVEGRGPAEGHGRSAS